MPGQLPHKHNSSRKKFTLMVHKNNTILKPPLWYSEGNVTVCQTELSTFTSSPLTFSSRSDEKRDLYENACTAKKANQTTAFNLPPLQESCLNIVGYQPWEEELKWMEAERGKYLSAWVSRNISLPSLWMNDVAMVLSNAQLTARVQQKQAGGSHAWQNARIEQISSVLTPRAN